MSAQPIDPSPDRATALVPMRLDDVEAVATIEKTIYTAPWSQGNFTDSLNAGYSAWVLRIADSAHTPVGRSIAGYFVLMPAVDEAHLLNVSVAVDWQRRGYGLVLLHKAIELAREYNARSIILEVRPSNTRALNVYRRFGFSDYGLRKRYYPVSAIDQTTREDALVMRLPL